MAIKIFFITMVLLFLLFSVCRIFDYKDLPEWLSASVVIGIWVCVAVSFACSISMIFV